MLPPDSLVLDGRFRVVRLLSEGGMGEVYLAEQVSLGRKVALKVLRADLSQQHQASERFRREAHLLSSVEHPAIVRVIDFGESDGRPCLVMELAEGETLQEALEPGPFPPERAVPVLIQLADGLAAIHEKGIVHRDLKPENVVLTRTVRGEQARWLDFGIARLSDPVGLPVPEGGLATASGVILGTPEYISPEGGFGGHLDPRSDLYSFGVLAYRTLSGVLPFPGPSPRNFVAQHISAQPLPLYQAAPQLVANTPLCELVMRCLAKNPNERPQSALELSEALARALRAPKEEPLPPEPPTPASGSQGLYMAPPPAETPAPPEPADEPLVPPAPWPPPSPVPDVLPELAERPRVPTPPPRPPTRPEPGPDSDALPELAERPRVPTPPPRPQARPAPHKPTSPPRRGLGDLPPAARAAGLGLLLVAATATIVVAVKRSRLENRARASLEAGHPEQVLELLGSDDAERAPLARVKALRAAALHRLDRHQEELREAAGVDLEAVGDLDAVLLDGLAQDYGKSHGRDPAVRKYFNSWPREQLRVPFRAMAAEPISPREWGALRYLDQANLAQGLNLVERYVTALKSTDCDIRTQAARRLRQLGSLAALDALEKQAAAPGCGQEEAVEAARSLRRRGTAP
ncbi:MAG TPA: serine/threonine-protein kinase [Myxococcaceae bacterium]|nr:serine/threonine-protein kinase [Myxococcaceae bacterium]